MGNKYEYTVMFHDDHGGQIDAVVHVADRHDILVIQQLLEY